MQITPRSGWGAAPPENPPTVWSVSSLQGICQHWFGSPKAAASHSGCDDLLRSVQRSHQAGEYNDIAYNFGVCPHGTVYELRGWAVQTGANGTSAANRTHLAIVYMAGTGDPLTDLGKASLRELYHEAFRRGVGQTVKRHGEFVGTSCPGPAVTAWINSGAWKPKPAPTLLRFRLLTGEGQKLAETGKLGAKPATQAEKLAAFLSNPTNVAKMLADFDHDKGRKEVEDVRIVRVWE